MKIIKNRRFYNIEPMLFFFGVVLVLFVLALAGCGNTISGVGQDIKDVGSKVTVWQNTSSKKEEVGVEKDKTK